jgi:hypothetical protein
MPFNYAIVYTGLFSDSICTVPLAYINECPVMPAYARGYNVSCPTTTTSLYTLGAQVTTVYSLSTITYGDGGQGQACQIYPYTSGFQGDALFSVGAEIPASSFVAATQSHD